jgi:hypothetical protein
MYDKHWSEEELVARLYGVGPEDGHLDVCDSCARRWEAVRCRYENLRRPAGFEVSEEFLAAQRRAIHARLREKRHRFPRVLVPVLVTLLLAAIVVVHRPAPESPPPVEKISDAQLFDDVFRMVSDPAPSAVGPIRSLFEEQK